MPRPFHNKVKTGCLTCKIRKVKCDETKPHCARCTKSGRKCDGYRPMTPAPSLVPWQSPAGLFASDAERRSFYYFQSHASNALGGDFNITFWGRQVLQAALHYRPLRHLVVALGAAYETYESRSAPKGDDAGMGFALKQANHSINQLAAFPASGTHSPETISCFLTASLLFFYLASVRRHLAEAVQHVQFAVKLLPVLDRALQQQPGGRTASPQFPIPVSQIRTLVASIYGQLRVMINDVTPRGDAPDILWSDDVETASIFFSLADAHAYIERLFHNSIAFLQATEFNPPTTPERLASVVARHQDLCQALESSQAALDALETSLRASPSPSPSPSPPYTAPHNPTPTSTSTSTSAPPSAPNTPGQPPLPNRDPLPWWYRGMATLRLYHLLISIRLRIDVLRPEQRESAFDELEAYLEAMLHHCEAIVLADPPNPDPNPNPNPHANSHHHHRHHSVNNEFNPTRTPPPTSPTPTCASGLGVVMPLHTVAARCRNAALRRRALALLARCGRREGLWDGELVGRIAGWLVELEEGGGGGGGGGGGDGYAGYGGEWGDGSELGGGGGGGGGGSVVGEDRRVRESKIELRGENRAVVRFVTVGDWKRGGTGVVREVEW